MERSHSASSGSTHQDDSWTCQRCGWVYPNAHPSAKHRRNHKKQCGKIKGFELRSEHKGGSSDEASSDDESHGKKESLPPRSPQAQHDGIRPIEAGSAVPAVEQPSGLQSRDLPVTEVNVSIPAAEHPSGLQSRDLPVTEVDVSSEVKLDTSIPAVEYPSGLQFRDLPVAKVDVSDEGKLDTSIPAVEHPSASQSRDLPVTAVNVSDTVKLDTPVLQGISAALDVKPETPAYGSTQNFITGDVAKSELPAPEHGPNTVFLNNTSTAFGEGKVMHATLVDTVEAPTLVLPRLDTKEAKEFVEQDTKFEDAPIELTREIALKTPEGHAKSDHASKIDRVEGVARDLPGLDIDLANSAQKKDAKSEGSAPEPAQSVASLDEPSRTLEEQSKLSLTPCVDEIAIAAQVSRGFDSGQARESHKKESSSIPKEQAANGLGSSHSSRDDDSWTCNRCGWVYPNPHPSAKHRRNHKKQCGKIKGFELRTEPHEGGSSDEVSSDGEMNVKKEHLPHPSPQILEAQDQANNPAATGSTPPGDDDPAVFREGRISTESGSSNLQSRDLSSSKGETPDKELSDTPNLTDFLTPDIKSSDVVPEVPENMASLVQQNPPEAENQKGAAVLDQITVVLCGPDTSETKELPKHSSLKEDTLPNPAIVQENLGSSETQLTTVISISKIVSTSASEGLDDQVKDTLVEYGSTNMLVETPDGPSGDCTPKVATSPSVPDECGSTNTLAETPDGLSGDCTPKVASIPSVSDDRGSTNMLAETPEGLSGNCTPTDTSILLVPDDPKSTSMLAETPETPDGLSEDCTPKVASVPSVPDDPGSTNMLAETPENSDGLSGDFTPKVAISPSVPDDCGSTNTLAETPDGLSGDCTPKVASIPSVSDDRGSTNMLAETPEGLSGNCTPTDTSILLVPDDPKSTSMLAETPETPDGLSEDCTPKVASVPSVPDDPGSTNMLAETPENSDGLSGDFTPKVAISPSVPDDCVSTNMLAETPGGLSGDCTPKVASIPSVPDDPGSTDRLAETPGGLSGDCTPKVASIPSARDDPGSANMLAETPEYPNGLLGDCAPKVASIPSVLDDYGSTNMLAEAPDGPSGDCTPKVANIPSGSDDRGSTNMLAETSDGLSGDCTLKFASIPPVPDSLPSSSSPAYIENKGASILKVDEPRLVVTAMDFGASGLSNETLDASTGAGLNQSVVITEGTDVSEKPGLDASSNFKNLDAMDHLLVHDPLRKETEETMTGGLEGRDGLLVLDKISSDLSPLTLTADKVLVENMPVKENLFSSTADVFGSANDSEEDGRFLSAQTSLNSIELITQNESMSEKVVRGNDDACSTGINKTDESTHSLEKQGTPVGVAEVDFSKEITTTADTTQEAIQGGLDIPGHVTSKNVSLNSEDFGQGVALVSAGGNTEIINTESSIAKDSYMSDKIKENETGGSYSAIDGHQVEITEAVEKPEAKEGTPCETRGIGSSNLSYTESGAGGNSSAIDGHQVKIAENGHAPEAVEKPEGKEDTPRETRGIESSDLSYPETNSVTRSETGVAGRLGLGASAHKLSDSLEIYEDAADSLETCSVGGSVEENENLDEPRQALDVVPEEPKHSGVALLDKRVPGESVGLDEEPSILNGSTTGEAVPGEIVGLYKEPSILNGLNGSSAGEAVPGESVGLDKKTSILNGSSAGEAISEEKITTLPGVSYAVRSKVEDLKAPSPEAWQEPGPSHVKSEGKRKISSTSEVTEDGRSGESHTALRSLMAKEGPEKVDQIVESITSAGDPQNLNKTGGSLASRNGTKPKSRSFWSHCICCPTVH